MCFLISRFAHDGHVLFFFFTENIIYIYISKSMEMFLPSSYTSEVSVHLNQRYSLGYQISFILFVLFFFPLTVVPIFINFLLQDAKPQPYFIPPSFFLKVVSIFISVMLQDAPFLVLRLLLIFRYDVLSYTNIFFTSKNSLVLVLQVNQ